MKKCPRCERPIYPINSASNVYECLWKDCGYSEAVKYGMPIPWWQTDQRAVQQVADSLGEDPEQEQNNAPVSVRLWIVKRTIQITPRRKREV